MKSGQSTKAPSNGTWVRVSYKIIEKVCTYPRIEDAKQWIALKM